MKKGTRETALIWIIVCVTTLLLGTVVQLLLWWGDDRTVIGALVHKPGLWGLYFIVGIFAGEHTRRFIGSAQRR